MPAIVALVVMSLSLIVTPSLAEAQPAITPCALTGMYVLAASLSFQGEAQFSGSFTFSPPASCTAGALGVVQLQLSVLFSGNPTQTPFAATLPYTVDASGMLKIGPGVMQGAVGGVTDTGIANVVVFEADPAISPATVRFAGTAVRDSLTGVNVLLAGSASVPALSFSTSPGTGLFSSASNTLDIATNGVDRLSISPSGDLSVLTGNLDLPNSTILQGNILKGGSLFLHNFGSQNTFLGQGAGNQTMSLTAGGQTAIGFQALASNTNQCCNTAIGTQALTNNTGCCNTAVGNTALIDNTTGGGNTATGYQALFSNSSGNSNTAFGDSALVFNSTASNNTAIGNSALGFNATGGNNTATGFEALFHNTTASNNTATGFEALFQNNNATGSENTAMGSLALASNTAGTGNTATGFRSLQQNTASFNTASGWDALAANTAGGDNTASGAAALLLNTGGSHNTASGVGALQSNVSGGDNTANGWHSLFTSTGNFNTATGSTALQNNTGNNNTAVGYQALQNSSGSSDNTAVGHQALLNGTGNSNTAIGEFALHQITGTGNIALGPGAGGALTGSTSTIMIGHAGVSGDTTGTIRIGTPSTQGGPTFIAGISGVNVGANPAVLVTSSGQLGVNTSSRRFKEDIRDMGDASADLLHLRPVTFRYKRAAEDGAHPLQYGLIAEEVAEIYPELVANDATGQPMTVLYHVLPVMLLNEVQRQQRRIDAQAALIAELTARLARLERVLALPPAP